MKFWIYLDWGDLIGEATNIKKLGPWPTQYVAECAAANFEKIYNQRATVVKQEKIENGNI